MKAVLLALLLLAVPGLSQDSKRPPIPNTVLSATASSGRYQIIPVTLDDGISQRVQTVFFLDTQTGDVWKYQESFTVTDANGKKKFVPPSFILIEKEKSFAP